MLYPGRCVLYHFIRLHMLVQAALGNHPHLHHLPARNPECLLHGQWHIRCELTNQLNSWVNCLQCALDCARRFHRGIHQSGNSDSPTQSKTCIWLVSCAVVRFDSGDLCILYLCWLLCESRLESTQLDQLYSEKFSCNGNIECSSNNFEIYPWANWGSEWLIGRKENICWDYGCFCFFRSICGHFLRSQFGENHNWRPDKHHLGEESLRDGLLLAGHLLLGYLHLLH